VIPVVDSRNLEYKVKSVREGVYARSLMATAIEELKLYPRDREKSMDDAVSSFRADTEVHAEGDNAFSITVRGRDPETAAKAANRLAELYIESNLQVRLGQVMRTRDIITQKLAELRGELTKTEAKVTAFKRANSDSLPELIDARFHQRDELTKQIELEETFIKEAQRRIDLLGTQPFGKDTEVGRLEEVHDTFAPAWRRRRRHCCPITPTSSRSSGSWRRPVAACRARRPARRPTTWSCAG